jgi:hypothetical protein
LDIVYGGDYVKVEGNKSTFTDTADSNGAALNKFPEGTTFAGKTITVSYPLKRACVPGSRRDQ